MNTNIQHLQCIDCGHQQPFKTTLGLFCEVCGSKWIDATYDYAKFKRELLKGFPDGPNNMWKFNNVLPIQDRAFTKRTLPALIKAGGTPLIHSERYANLLGHPSIYIKDERQGPTSSFKDRQAAVAVAAMADAGIEECVIASTGNAAVAYASACAEAGIKLWVFMTSLVPQEKLREAALFGAEVVRVSGTYDQTKQMAAKFASRRNLLLDRGATSLPAREAFKTIAYEIVEQMGWEAPEWYIQAVSGGLGPLGVYRGFQELFEMGIIDRIPKLGIIQADGCAPMVAAFKAGKAAADPVVPNTRIAILSTGDPGHTYTLLWELTQKYGGAMESVTDGEAFQSMQRLAKAEGMAVEPATAVAFAGLEKLIAQGLISEDEKVVVNCTGHTFPVEKHVLGDQWQVDVQLGDGQFPVPQEGLQAALEHLVEKTTTVLLVEDNPDDALLIKRMLNSHKSYRVHHVDNGRDGLQEAQKRNPDLIMLDMMMPDLDGPGFLKELKEDERTRDIPVVIVSAKELSNDFHARLKKGEIKGYYQKGSLSPASLINHVSEVLDNETQKN